MEGGRTSTHQHATENSLRWSGECLAHTNHSVCVLQCIRGGSYQTVDIADNVNGTKDRAYESH